MTTSPLARLLAPKSIAFIGGWEAETALRVTQELGFDGAIHAIHPKRDHLNGVPCLRTIAELPQAPDCAFIAVKRELAVQMIGELSAMGCGGVVLYSSGFAELDDTGKALEADMLKAANGMPVMGPNCYGYVNALDKCSPWPDEHGMRPVERGVVFITQSGNIACNFAMMKRHVPVAGLFTLGNQADVGMSAMIAHLAGDSRVTAIGLHIEGLKDVAAFSRAALAARAAAKPIVVLKTGRSEQGAKVTMSHTNSLSGADDLYDAMFARYGIARVNSVSALCETLKFLHYGGPINDTRLVSMSCSGGEAALVSDMGEAFPVSFPAFDPATHEKVAATLSEYVVVDNPLDYHTFIWNQRDKLAATFSAVLSGGFDVGLLVIDIPDKPPMNPATWIVTVEGYIDAHKATGARAVTVTSLHESMPAGVARRLTGAGIAPMLGLDDAFTAFAAAAMIGRNWAQAETPAPLSPAHASEDEIGSLTEREAKALLAEHGLRVPAAMTCPIADAGRTAQAIGFPVVVKASSVSLAHKTEAGGVALNLSSPEGAQAAADAMAGICSEVLVEQMITGTVAELIVGVKRDPQFGLALVIGAGGILTELLADSATLLLPATRGEIGDALRSLRVFRLIEGYRGKAGDPDAVLDAIEAVASFAVTHDSTLEELDVNPLMVLENGKGAIAADALIRIRKD
ncbi:MAG: acetate--CoA ligase family protein [Anderseniella sp.]|jgi:acyl-CoA synthetase (NDP forming)|nr:acetate--CoA ligase family protein [Anderseniella sp.]